MRDIASLKTCFDEIEETNGDDEWKAWLSIIYDAKLEIATFVAGRRGRGKPTEYVDFIKGSFNFGFRFRFDDDGPDAIIRFPKPGHTATPHRDEKVTNEVQVMQYLRDNTTIPVPRVLSWGLTAESPQQLGPFIIKDHIEGTLLSTVLNRKPESGDEDTMLLNPNIDGHILDKVYRQIAQYLLQLSRLVFTRIGAISREDGGTGWSVNKRPLTYNMNELTSVAGYPSDLFPTSPFDHAGEYLRSVAREHLAHLRCQRNLADNPDIARARFIARHRIAQLVPIYCTNDDAGPFIPFCDDLRPSNMLVDPDTLEIKAVIDWEYTNAMPAQFSYDPPWWLLLSGPEDWLERNSGGSSSGRGESSGLQGFRDLYEPRMEQFLRAMEAVEEEERLSEGSVRLSARMRESWRSGRFWFDYAIRKSFELDVVYWAALHDGDGDGDDDDENGVESLDSVARQELEAFVTMKMEQLKAYNEEVTARFSKE